MAFFRSTPKLRLLATAAPPGLLAMVATPAFAQTAPAPASGGQATTDDQSQPDIVITGSLLSRADKETPSPVTILTSENLARAGITSAAEAIRSISADSAGSIGTGFQTGFSAGGSAVSLRGLGVSSTLVLIDGLRSTNFPINDDGHNAYVDLNSVPFSLIDRIEVLKDGASSTYGADAIGGVVNLILKKTFTGLAGNVEGGVTEKGDGSRYRASLTAGIGDYESQGWNVYLNGEYQRDGRISNNSRGFPYNTQDLTPIGGNDNNSADQSLTVNTPTAYVVRTTQGNLNNPLTGGTTVFNDAGQTYATYTALGIANCARPTYTVSTGSARGVGCPYDLTDLYRQIQPLQERYSVNGRLSVRLSNDIEGYVTGSFSRSYVNITSAFPSAIRQTQPFGGSPLVATSNPGIVLPVWICPSGVNCANPATAGRTLNPNNPYAAAFANDPGNGAARIYYLFSDIPGGSERTNDVYRFSAGLNGSFGDDWKWRVESVYAKDNLTLKQHGLINIAALATAINTGSYNFVNPQLNSAAVRAALAPDKVTPSDSSMFSLDASISKKLFDLPGGPLQFAIGGQVRRETLTNNNQNAALDTYGLTTSSAFGKHTVWAGYFEVDAPILKVLDVNVSGRYDKYSEGYGRFSPKVGIKFEPIPELALRGTYSQGFRAPTFAEAGPRSQYAGFVTTNPPGAFCAQHGGSNNNGACVTGGNPYNFSYSVGRGFAGNPNLKPEKSRSFTAGAIFQPARWFSATIDYYNVKKTDLVANGPLAGAAISAYYSVAANAYPSAAAASAAGCAAVAAVGAGYSCNLVDGVDPLFPNALPRVLIVNAPFVNVNSDTTEGLDFSATLTAPIGGVKFTSRVEATYVIRYDRDTAAGIQKFAGTLGPYDLSSGNGTPRIRGNWQNTLEIDNFSLNATAYYVGRIKEIGTDQGSLVTDCSANLYRVPASAPGYSAFCYINSFINVDLNASVKVNDKFTFYFNVGNVLNARAPVAPAAYASAPNFLTTWHYAGLVGRKFSAGANFKF